MTIFALGANGAGRLQGGRAAHRPSGQQGGFHVHADAAPELAAAQFVETHVTASLSALRQADAGSDEVRDRAARRHGQDVLGELSRLQRDLLGSPGAGGGRSGLERLASLAAARPDAADPVLAQILDGIVLRAQVELARWLQP